MNKDGQAIRYQSGIMIKSLTIPTRYIQQLVQEIWLPIIVFSGQNDFLSHGMDNYESSPVSPSYFLGLLCF